MKSGYIGRMTEGHPMNLAVQAFLACCVAASPAMAGTRFGMKQITIDGSSFVQASAINNHNAIAGIYIDGSGSPHGFVKSGSILTVLPPVIGSCATYECYPVPSSINAAGDVAGFYYFDQEYSFLWRGGAYVDAGSVLVGLGGTPQISINNRGVEIYDDYQGHGLYTAYTGKPGAYVPVTPPGSFPFVQSLNTSGTVAGQYFSPTGLAIFTETAGVYKTLIPPGAMDSSGGFINDRGQVAGIYQDTQGNNHGFIYKAGTYTRFDIPGAPATVVIDGINNKGRVVGVYTDAAANEQRVFLFNGTKLTPFGHYGANDIVHVAINDAGVMIVSDTINLRAIPNSFRVLCVGDGC